VTSLEIRRLRASYRLPAPAGPLRRRLDGVLERVADEGLAVAMRRLGAIADEEICVRSVETRVRLRLSGSDSALCAAWSSALAEAIEQMIRSGSPDVVRYRSRRAALADFACAVASGRLERAWAWRRLGIWNGPDAATAREACAELTWALLREPEAIVPVLAETARGGRGCRRGPLGRGARRPGVSAAAARRRAGAPRR
jgi:hypothetical protein